MEANLMPKILRKAFWHFSAGLDYPITTSFYTIDRHIVRHDHQSWKAKGKNKPDQSGVSNMTASDISVELRLSTKTDTKVKAFADVTIPLGSDGLVKVSGFSVIQRNSDPPRVVPPARKGEFRYFDTVALIGKIRSIVDEAVMAEYERVRAARA
jgi:DNA-binding cell septation regulator SpoVG